MNVLIVGGAGFIGSHLVDYHLSVGDTVQVVDNLSTGRRQNIERHENNKKFYFYETDFLEWKDMDAHVAESEFIYDLAAVVGMFNVLEHPIETLHFNLNITEKLLESMSNYSKNARILVASSSEVYGSRLCSMTENMPLLIESTNKAHASYPISKLCNEIQALAWNKEQHLSVIVVRIFNTVGPRQSSRYGMVLPRFIQQALQNEPLSVFGDGHQTRSFCDVRDLSKMLYQLMQTDKSLGEVINVGNESDISILNLAKLVLDITQSKAGLMYQPMEEVYGKEYIDIEQRKPDLTKLKSIIKYAPEWTLKDTIANMVDSLKRN